MSKPVLIVDDDVDHRMLMQEILELFGHRVLAAAHGGEACNGYPVQNGRG